LTAWIVLGLFPTCALAGPDRSAYSAALEQQYPKTTYDRSRDHIKAVGPVFVLAKDGLRVDPSTDIAIIYNDLVDGQIVDPRGGSFGVRQNSVRLNAGDKVYITGFEVKEDEAKISLLTKDTFDVQLMGQPRTIHFTTILRIKYAKGYLDTISPGDLLKTVEAVILPQDAAVPEAHPPAAAAEPSPPPAPPEPTVPKTPVTIAPGETVAQVTAKLGQPQQILDKGNVKVYIYPNMKVTFTDGLVTDLD